MLHLRNSPLPEPAHARRALCFDFSWGRLDVWAVVLRNQLYTWNLEIRMARFPTDTDCQLGNYQKPRCRVQQRNTITELGRVQ